ncbi:MAG TPA: hypothetical protein VMJ66_17190 [Geobacteraceae bacterium]|nr:hypothetical protein [Geobacteraceae bacterium]
MKDACSPSTVGCVNGRLKGQTSASGVVGAAWGIAGVILLLGSAVYRLTTLALAAFSFPFEWYHWLAWTASVVFMAHAEGYRGFQLHFSPRVAARALYLRNNPRVIQIIFAPLFCMGYFHATRRRQIISISLTACIIALVLAVHRIPQPWRGIIDAGVVTGLAWGCISLIWFSIKAFCGREYNYSPEVPEEEGRI